MKHVAHWALNASAVRGASYADVRVIAQRNRSLTTKNGKVGSASDAESVGMNVRVIADGAWGFAASAELGRGAVEATAARAVEIARASARVKRENVQLAHEKPAVAEWSTPYKVDPFTISVEQNIELLLKIDAELKSVNGITLAEDKPELQPRGAVVPFRRKGRIFIRRSSRRELVTPRMRLLEMKSRSGRIRIRLAGSGRTKGMS